MAQFDENKPSRQILLALYNKGKQRIYYLKMSEGFPSIIRNTLFSTRILESLLLREENIDPEPLRKILDDFKKIRDFGSEIHTENSLVKPILKTLSFPYESKPRFFEEGVKDPDYALFSDEEEREKARELWGSSSYYDHVLCILVLKRYGRNLWEGINSHFLDFEKRIPFYQLLYFLKKTSVKWGILTNGRMWILLSRPVFFEKKFIEFDLEKMLELMDLNTLKVFSKLISPSGLQLLLPQVLEEERVELFRFLKEKKENFREIFMARNADPSLKTVESIENVLAAGVSYPTNAYNLSEICSYLLLKKDTEMSPSMEEVFPPLHTKEKLLSIKLLDMTPNFGTHLVQLIDCISYISSITPYKEQGRFVNEWEKEESLLKHIARQMIYGIERSALSLEVIKKTAKLRYGIEIENYRFGNPLIGLPLKDLFKLYEDERQPSLFQERSIEVVNEFIRLQREFLSLSDRIKEDLELKEEIRPRLLRTSERIRDILDTYVSTYFLRGIEKGHVMELLSHIEDTEEAWQRMREKEWFKKIKTLSKKQGFFHMELEFPFLLLEGFDLILIDPDSTYVWEDEKPFFDFAKAYIKRAIPYLKIEGRIVILTKKAEELYDALSGSKRFNVKREANFLLLTLKDQSPSHPFQR